MPNIADIGGRRLQQRQITQNRDAILPTRRNTEAPNLQVRSDLRTASRGDGGAEELRRALGQFGEAAEGAYNAQTVNNTDKYRAEAAEGAADAATGGAADPERARSSPYQQAFYNLRAESQFNTFSADVAEQAEQMVNDGGDPDEVQAFVLERFTAFNTEVMDTIPESNARFATATRLASLGRTLETNIGTRIRERMTEESVSTLQGNIRTALASNQPFDFEARRAEAVALNLPPAKANEVVMQGVLAVALDRDNPNPDLIDDMMDSVKADGVTPSFNAAEMLQLQNSYAQAVNLRDNRERELQVERREAFMTEWLPKALNGEHATEAIHAAMLDGTIDPTDGQGLIGMLEGYRDQKVQGQVNEQFALDVEYRASTGRPYTNSQIMAFHREGRFGTGTAGYGAAIRALTPPSQLGGGGSGTGGRGPGVTSGGGMSGNEGRRWAWGEVQTMLVPEDEANPYDRRMNAEVVSYFNSWQDGRRGRVGPEEALTKTVAFRERARQASARRSGTQQPAASGGGAAAGNYTYVPGRGLVASN